MHRRGGTPFSSKVHFRKQDLHLGHEARPRPEEVRGVSSLADFVTLVPSDFEDFVLDFVLDFGFVVDVWSLAIAAWYFVNFGDAQVLWLQDIKLALPQEPGILLLTKLGITSVTTLLMWRKGNIKTLYIISKGCPVIQCWIHKPDQYHLRYRSHQSRTGPHTPPWSTRFSTAQLFQLRQGCSDLRDHRNHFMSNIIALELSLIGIHKYLGINPGRITPSLWCLAVEAAQITKAAGQ